MNIVAVRLTTIEVTNCRFRMAKQLKHNLLHKPALTKVLCKTCIFVIY
jgi:hypothetical protein